MSVDTGRRALLRGQIRSKPVLRPPWTKVDFTDLCTRCNACIMACPEHIIQRGDGGFPYVDFEHDECTFCRACANACEQDVFIDTQTHSPWQHIAHINQDCLTATGIVCQSCRDLCGYSAIRLQYSVGNVPSPEINAENCTGCGACVAVCPSKAISIQDMAQL